MRGESPFTWNGFSDDAPSRVGRLDDDRMAVGRRIRAFTFSLHAVVGVDHYRLRLYGFTEGIRFAGCDVSDKGTIDSTGLNYRRIMAWAYWRRVNGLRGHRACTDGT